MQAGLAASVLRCDPQPAGLHHHSPPRMCMLVSSKTQAALGRRSWLLRCLGALGLHVASTAQDQRSVSAFVKLKEPVLLPLDKVAEPWRPVGFIARCSVPARPQRPSAEVRLKGVLLRLPRPSGDATVLRSYCLTCPHEICQVDLTEETKAVRVDNGRIPQHPVFVCSCHFSAFDPLSDGARIAGPAHRGLYRFGLEVRGAQIAVYEVEQAALV